MRETQYELRGSMDERTGRRGQKIERVEALLGGAGRPRLTMMAIMILAWMAGFLSSAGLLRLGVESMWLRYPLAVGGAYLAFLGLLGAWLRVMLWGRARSESAANANSASPRSTMAGAMANVAAGLSRVNMTEKRKERTQRQQASYADGSLLDLCDLGGGSDSGAVVLILALIALLSGLIVSGIMVATAPLLFAELLVDGLAVMAVSRSVGRSATSHWTDGVVRRTWLPAFTTAVVFGLVGLGLQFAAPGSATLAQAWQISHQKPAVP